MRKHLFIIPVIWFPTTLTATGQNAITIDSMKVSHANELNFSTTDKRGIKSENNVIYFVGKDMQTVTAYQNGLVKWRVNIIQTCGKPAVGKSAIRYLKVDDKEITVIFGKHSFASVDKECGKAKFLGSD